MSWDNNPYYNPEKMGLSTVAEFDAADSWDFDKFVVWTDGKVLFWAADSGCSCPIPFEDINSLGDLRSGRQKECLAAIDTWIAEGYHRDLSGTVALKDSVRAWKRGGR